MAALLQPFSRTAISLGWAELTTRGLNSPKRCRCQLMAGPYRHTSSTSHNRCCQSISKQYLLFCLCSVWTTETVCKVLRATIEDKDPCLNSKGSEDEGATHYPCLQVWVNLTASGQEVMLYQTEDTLERNPKVLEHIPLSPPAAIQHLPQLQFNFEHICGIGCH